ncbi:3-isopropylmalate dehydratase small subunit [Peribacillus aracenensis]|uniref:DUF126 domain-containing protein n=1 Tax=Peribacillus aracenensis TaxID=2976708 RepID=UPI0021A47EEE|nr:DUF126 domain-containing protein [Peribacillus sp. BBB004]
MAKTNEMLSFWRGFDLASGKVTGRHHSLYGERFTYGILAMPLDLLKPLVIFRLDG